MKRIFCGRSVLVYLMLAFATASCQDTWQDHYYAVNEGKIDMTLTDYIESQPDLTTFTRLLQETGYDSILNHPQSFTVWAFQDTPADSAIDWEDSTYLKRLVSNHIAYYQFPVSKADSSPVSVLNQKKHYFDLQGTTATFDGVNVSQSDIALKNGLLHVIDASIPYLYNAWEYILNAEGLDSLQRCVSSLWMKTLDMDKSYEDNILVDSVFMDYNIALENWGDLDVEDSIYTVLLPENAAWLEAYNKTRPCFVSQNLTLDGIDYSGSYIQNYNTYRAMIQDLVYYGRIVPPVAATKLISTNWTAFSNPDSLFLNTTRQNLSNGIAYRMNNWTIPYEKSWCKTIRVEAEKTASIDTFNDTYADIYSNTSIGSGFDVSNNAFLYLVSTSNSSFDPILRPWVRIKIPNTLSMKYNIYAVFVPSTIADSSDKRPSKVRFSISYVNALGTQVYNTETTGTFITNASTMTKMLVYKGFKLPYTNLITSPGMYTTSDTKPTVMLRIENMSTVSEKKTYDRNTRIDCILLEPVLE
jgi:uncharacterized surface protein with fasciclin (FAS1) repeats